MKLVCELRDYRGDKTHLICVIDPRSCRSFWPKTTGAQVQLSKLLDGSLLAVYEHEEVPHEPKAST